MKILHITATHLNKYGGIPVVLENLVKYQNEIDGAQSVVLSINSDIDNINSDDFKYIKEIDEIKCFIESYSPDITIFHSLYFTKYTKVYKILNSLNLKYYIEPHGSFMKTAQNKGKVKKMIANKLLFNNFIHNAYGYIFLNESEMNNSIFRTENDLIIPNGIDANEYDLKKKSNKKIKLFFIGRIDINHKGLDILFDNLKKLDCIDRDFEVNIYGVGNEREVEILNNYINEINNIDVSFKGPIYDEDKIKVLEENNIMILTSRYEGFPMAILEALSYGNPCIVTDGTNVKSMIESNNLGWGAEYDSIDKTIEYALNDYKHNKDLYINNSINFVNENYSWEKIAKKSISILQNHTY